ncbi:MAG TPA: CpsB/CapC family capsule biosynthesis tyrosine phosphatase [Bryobacteraceae bacterium]
MVDIHSHIFWGVDDGADTRETTLAMLRVASESGTTDIVGTPHANAESAPDAEVIDRQMEDLNRAVDGKPRIHRGCELHVSFDAIQDALANPRKYTVNGKNFLLLEFAAQIPPHAEDLLMRLADAGMDPIVAHAERNPVLARKLDQLEKWCERGVLVQITAKSLEGGFGPKALDAAWRMLARGLVHFVASDAHDPEHRPPRLDLARDLVRRKMDEDAADLLFTGNPRNVVEGRNAALVRPPAAQPQPWWHSFMGRQ